MEPAPKLPEIGIERGPNNLTIISVPADIPYIVIEIEAPGPPAPWGKLHPQGRQIAERISKSPSVLATYACPHGAIAIILLDQHFTPQEKKQVRQQVQAHLKKFLKGSNSKPRIRAKFAQESRTCSKAYQEELDARDSPE